MEGDVAMKPLGERERLQSILQATEQVMQALRAVPHDPAVAQLLGTKQCEAEQTRAAFRATRPIRTQVKAAVESRDKLMKKHAAIADGVQSSVAQLQSKQAELAELANALRDKVQLVAQLQERVRAEELAEVPSIHIGNAPGSMSAAQWAEGLATALKGSHAASFRNWLAGCQATATRPTVEEISDLEDEELWRRMNQASTVCGNASDCGASDRAAVARRKCTVLHADTRAALHTVTGKLRRGEGEGEGQGGHKRQRRAADEGLRSIGDAAFSHRPCRDRAVSRSHSHSPGQQQA